MQSDGSFWSLSCIDCTLTKRKKWRILSKSCKQSTNSLQGSWFSNASPLWIVWLPNANYFAPFSQNQYKRQFGLWNISKALPSKKKEKITKVLQTRSRQRKNTAVTYNGHDQSNAMRRYLKDQMRQNVALLPKFSLSIENLSGHALQCGNRL